MSAHKDDSSQGSVDARPSARPDGPHFAGLAEPYRDLRDATDAVATAAENTAQVLRERAYASGFDTDLIPIAQGWEQFACELREISQGEGVVRCTPQKGEPTP